jgi:hypothetical protein
LCAVELRQQEIARFMVVQATRGETRNRGAGCRSAGCDPLSELIGQGAVARGAGQFMDGVRR